MTAYRAGSRACSWLIFFFIFFFFVVFFRSKKWASNEALSQQRGIEPATWHWASNEGMVNLYCTGPMDFPMQPLQFQQIKLLINSGTIWDKIEDWESIHTYAYIYIYCEQNYPCSGYVVWLIVSEVLRTVSSVSIVHCRGTRALFNAWMGSWANVALANNPLKYYRGY